jgi:hypothetical protein
MMINLPHSLHNFDFRNSPSLVNNSALVTEVCSLPRRAELMRAEDPPIGFLGGPTRGGMADRHAAAANHAAIASGGFGS